MQDKNAAFKADMNDVCENRILYNCSANVGYYNQHNDDEARTYSKSIKNKTIDLNDFTVDKNYFYVPYIYGTDTIVILATTAISPYLLPITFYHFIINKKATIYFNERKLFSHATMYSFFNISYQIQKFKNENNKNTFFGYNADTFWVYDDKIMSKKLFYTNPYYSSK